MDIQNIKKNFWENGYAVIRNIYTKDQIIRFRNFIKKTGEEIAGSEQKDWRTLQSGNY